MYIFWLQQELKMLAFNAQAIAIFQQTSLSDWDSDSNPTIEPNLTLIFFPLSQHFSNNLQMSIVSNVQVELLQLLKDCTQKLNISLALKCLILQNAALRFWISYRSFKR